MIQYKKGNLMEDSAAALVNTVNLDGIMGKGIALAFKNAFPHNFAVYAQACKDRSLTIGRLCIVNDDNLIYGRKTIINFPTKAHWRNPSEYAYISLGLVRLRECLLDSELQSIAIPALGCGNGGLDWQQVKHLIEKHLSGLALDIRIYEP